MTKAWAVLFEKISGLKKEFGDFSQYIWFGKKSYFPQPHWTFLILVFKVVAIEFNARQWTAS